MICKNCGKEIAEDSLFCEFCGKPCQNVLENTDKKTNAKLLSKKKKGVAKVIGYFVLVAVLLIGYFSYVSYWYGNHYYGNADVAIEKMSYNGEQLVSNIEFDAENNYLKLNLSENNFEEAIPDSLDIRSISYILEENYCVYDYNIKDYCFEYVNPTINCIDSNEENKSHYSKYLVLNNEYKLEEGKVYRLGLEFYLCLNEDYGNIFRKLFIKTIENPYVSRYIYKMYNNPSNYALERFEANSYFVYENGVLKPITNANIENYVNAVWNDTDLNIIKYDGQGNMYLEGPVRNRENIKIDNN